MVGAAPVRWEPVHTGYTAAGRWIARLGDGSSVFVKAATSGQTAAWLREEHRIYQAVRGRFLPVIQGWEDEDDRPLLLLEDLSGAHWPPPWSPEQVERLLGALSEMAASPPPAGLPRLEDWRDELCGWSRVAADPRPFLSLGLCTRSWLDRALPALVVAERAARLEGDGLLHLDVRSDNVCFAGDRAVLVDWNWACVGNPRFDVAAWLPSLHAEGGPAPEAILPDEPELAAAISGFFACKAGLPPGDVSPRVRSLQRRQLATALPWAARALSLPGLAQSRSFAL